MVSTLDTWLLGWLKWFASFGISGVEVIFLVDSKTTFLQINFFWVLSGLQPQDLLIILYTIRNLDYCALYLHYLQSSALDYIEFSWWNDVNLRNLIHHKSKLSPWLVSSWISLFWISTTHLLFHLPLSLWWCFFGMISFFLVICKLGA